MRRIGVMVCGAPLAAPCFPGADTARVSVAFTTSDATSTPPLSAAMPSAPAFAAGQLTWMLDDEGMSHFVGRLDRDAAGPATCITEPGAGAQPSD